MTQETNTTPVVGNNNSSVTIDNQAVASDNLQNPQVTFSYPYCGDNLTEHIPGNHPAEVPQVMQPAPGIMEEVKPIVNTEAPQVEESSADETPVEPITDEEAVAVAQAVTQPVMQGQIVESKPKHPGGRPSKYNERMLKIAQDYLMKCRGDIDGKPRMPFIEELAMLCNVDDKTINTWTEEENNTEFRATINKLKNLQKLRTIQRGFNAKNPTFAIFMLKANHGMMETEKQVLVADRDVKVSITRE